MKVFEGEALPDLIKRCRAAFDDVSVLKPRASRDVSKETFIIGRGYRPGRAGRTKRSTSGPPQPVEGWST